MQTFVVLRAYRPRHCITVSALLTPTRCCTTPLHSHITTLQSGPDRTPGCPAAGCHCWAAAPEGVWLLLVCCQLLLAAREPCPQTVCACTTQCSNVADHTDMQMHEAFRSASTCYLNQIDDHRGLTGNIKPHHRTSSVSSGWKAVASRFLRRTATATDLTPSACCCSSGVRWYSATRVRGRLTFGIRSFRGVKGVLQARLTHLVVSNAQEPGLIYAQGLGGALT